MPGAYHAGSAFALLRDGASQPLESIIDDRTAVRGSLTALRDEYCHQLEVERTYATALEAEEGGEARAACFMLCVRLKEDRKTEKIGR
jgi:hypothetical protein